MVIAWAKIRFVEVQVVDHLRSIHLSDLAQPTIEIGQTLS